MNKISPKSSDLTVIKRNLCCKNDETKTVEEEEDEPLPGKLIQTVEMRVVHDSIVCVIVLFIAFAVHVSTAFTPSSWSKC